MSQENSPFFDFLFVKPVLGVLLAILLMLGGFVAYSGMIKESDPDLKLPNAQVVTTWGGSPPSLVEKEVTTPLEKKILSLKGVKKLESISKDSVSSISVEFEADAPLEESMNLLRAKVNEAEAELPKDADKPDVQQVSVTDKPIVTFVLYGNLADGVLGDVAQELKKRLERVSGVREATLAGHRHEVVRVQLSPDRLKALGLSSTEVKQALVNANMDAPWGKVHFLDENAYSLRMSGSFSDLTQLKVLPVKRVEGGRVIRLWEVAGLSRDLDEEKTRTYISWQGGEFLKGVSVSVTKTPGRDTLKLIDQCKAEVAEFAASEGWPSTLRYQVSSDESESINEKLSNVFNNGWQAMLAVFLILLVVLTWREALVAGVSLPLTFLGSLVVLWTMGYTMNQLVVIGMVLALGMLVDVFILVMEGMHDFIYVQGKSFDEAARGTVRLYALPALAGQLTTILAMAPLFAIGGVDGKFIQTIPATAITCLVVSYVVAFWSSVPISRAVLGRRKKMAAKTRMDQLTDKVAASLRTWLDQAVLASRWRAAVWIVLVLAVFVLSTKAAGLLPSELYPKTDGRNLGVTVELEPGVTLDHSQRVAEALGNILRGKDYLTSVTMYVGKKSPFATEAMTVQEETNLLGFSAMFIPLAKRDKMGFEYLEGLRAELERALAVAPGARLMLSVETGGAGGGGDPIAIVVYGDDMNELRRLSNDVQFALAGVPGATDVRDNLGPARRDVVFRPDREAMDFYDINEQELTAQVRLALTSEKAGTFDMPGTEDNLDILVGTEWPSRKGAMGGLRTNEELAYLSVMGPKGDPVPLLSLAGYTIEESAQSIVHKDGGRSVTVLAKTEGRTVNEVLGDALPKLRKMSESWPRGYRWSVGGEAEKAGETYAAVPAAMGLALFMVFAVLALVFQSFKKPFIIMFTVPMALIGTLGGFFLAWIPMSFPAMVGIIALVGIVVNNAIIMLQTMDDYMAQGMPVRQAAGHGAADRLRPILSTTITTLVGLVPLAISDPLWMPLCAAIIFGLVAATGIALVVIPGLYLIVVRR